MLNRQVFLTTLLSALLMTGFKCGSSSSSSTASTTSTPKPDASAAPMATRRNAINSASAVKGLLRLRIVSSGAALVDKLNADTATVRIWDWEHEASPDPAKEMKVEEVISDKDEMGEYQGDPELYIELPGVTCKAGEDPEAPCNVVLLKIDSAFIAKIRKDGNFRAALGRMLGQEVTVDKGNPVFLVEDVQ